MARKPSKKSLNASLDRLASIQARERAKGMCERCGRPATQTHHFMSRRFRRLRWHRANLIATCAACHRFAHDCAAVYAEWFRSHRPEDYAYCMKAENRAPINRSVADLQDLRDEMAA